MLMRPLKKLRDRLNSNEKSLNNLQCSVDKLDRSIDGLNVETVTAKEDILNQIKLTNSRIERLEANFNLNYNLAGSKSKTILVAGFFGAFNLGDELMLETALGYLREYRPEYSVTIMLSDNYGCDITRYGDYDFIHHPNTPLELNSIANTYDCILFSGGALIDDAGYSLESRPLTFGTILANLGKRFIQLDKQCLVFGLSSNPSLSSSEFIEKIDFLAQKADLFSVRDTNSIKALSDSGVDTSKIKLVDDIVFANPQILKRSTKKHNEVIGLIYVYSEANMQKLTSFTRRLLEVAPKDYSFKLIPFYDYMDNDLVFASQLIEKINNPRLSIDLPYAKSFSQATDLLASKSMIISMRYHGTLLSNLLNRKTLCIDYDVHTHYTNKNSFLFTHYRFEKNIIPFSELENVKDEQILKWINSKNIKINDLREIHKRAASSLIQALEMIQ